jgi:hypothetical protein
VIAKSALTCTNCGKTGHSVETCHNRKKEVLIVPIVTIKFTKPVVGIKTQPIKLGKIPIHYPCINCSNAEHGLGKCPRKIEVHNMFRIKLVSSNATIASKPPKIDNVLVNVVFIITTCSQ